MFTYHHPINQAIGSANIVPAMRSPLPWTAIVLGEAQRMNPKVSLILTVHNREQYLREAIASVQAQAYPNYELILWDDGSTDNSGAIAATKDLD